VLVTYILRRSLFLLAVIWTASTLIFFIPKLTPGRNPIREKLMQEASRGGFLQQGMEEMIKAYESKFGLDRPLWDQYINYISDMARFNLGYSISNYPKTVIQLIGEALPWTIGLLVTTTLISFALGTLLGALIAWPRSPRWFRALVPPLMTLSAVPYYILGLLLIYIFAFRLKIFPLGGGYSTGTVPALTPAFMLDILKHSILPALSIVLSAVGFWALGMRGMMITVQGEDFMTFAEAKGLPQRRVFLNYAVRNALLPQTTSLALSLGHVASGSTLVEVVFGYPGIGTLLARSIAGFDYFTIYGIVFLVIVGIAIATLLLDLLYPLLDPRISYGGS
jgi:peptide/nickel transport system permease protein